MGKNYPALKEKLSLMVYNAGKNITPLHVGEKNVDPEVRGKNSYPKQITHS